MKRASLALLALAAACAMLAAIAMRQRAPARTPTLDDTPRIATPSLDPAGQSPTASRLSGAAAASNAASVQPVTASTEATRLPTAAAAVTPAPIAASTLRDFIEHGDPRSPPLVDEPAVEVLPSREVLADAKAYRRYESDQNAALIFSFASAARTALDRMRQQIETIRRAGATPAQLQEAEDKMRHLEAVLQRVDPASGELR